MPKRFWILYLLGIFLGIVFSILRIIRVIIVENQERLVPQEKGLILVCNHPSKLDPGLAPFLFIWRFIFHPIRFTPWSTPDEKEYYRKWWFYLFRPICISVDRTDTGRSQARATRQMLRILRKGGIIILFIEGTRTFKAIRSGGMLVSATGKALGISKEGIGFLAIASGATVVPVWFEETDEIWPNGQVPIPDMTRLPIRIKIGQGRSFSREKSQEEVTQEIANALLILADQ